MPYPVHALNHPALKECTVLPTSSPHHRIRLIAAAAAGAALFTAVSACSSSKSSSAAAAAASAGTASSYAIRVGFIANTATPANPEGFYDHDKQLLPALRKSGVTKVSWLPFKNGPDLSAALSGGSLDLGILGDTPAVTSKGSGVDTRLVNQESLGQDTWLFGAKHGPTSIQDLAGKTVATQVGSYMYRYLLGVLDQAGLTGKVKVTHVYTTAALAALKSGGIAAYAAPAGQLSAAMQSARFTLIDKASTDHSDLLGTSVTVISQNALKRHPGLPAAWNATRTASVTYADQHAQQYYAYAAKASQTTTAVIQSALPLTHYPSTPFTAGGLAKLQSLDAYLVKQKLLKKPVSITAWRTI